MPPELFLRATDLRDPEVVELLALLPWGTEGIVAEQFDPPGGAVLVAARERPLGCCGLRALPADPATATATAAATVGEIKRLFVREDARGQGLARTLLAEAEELAAELGYDELRLDTHAEGPASLFAAVGYAPIEPYNDNPYATHFFAKSLA